MYNGSDFGGQSDAYSVPCVFDRQYGPRVSRSTARALASFLN